MKHEDPINTKIAELTKKIESLPMGAERDNLIKEKVVLEWIRDGEKIE